MFKQILAVVIVMLMSLAAGNASAMMCCDKGMMDCKCMAGEGAGMMAKGEGMAGRFRMMIKMLDLNAEQRKAVEAIHAAHHKEVIKKEADIDVAKLELQEILDKEPLNVMEAEKQIRAIAVLQADLEVMHLKAKEAIKAKLTPEQLEKMKKHMAEAMGEKQEEMGGMGMGDCRMCDKSKKCNMMDHDSEEMRPRHHRHR